jgi:hypothetical protein
MPAVLIEEKPKFEMNARGAYVAPGQRIDPDGPERPPPRSFRVSCLTSRVRSRIA